MKAQRRRFCHPIFEETDDLDGFVQTLVRVFRRYDKAGTLPSGLTVSQNERGRFWLVSADAPQRIGSWVALDLDELGPPPNCLWIGYSREKREYAVVAAVSQEGKPGIVLQYTQSLGGICYKNGGVN